MEYFPSEFIHKDDSSKYYRTTCKWLYTIIINTILNKYNILVIKFNDSICLESTSKPQIRDEDFFLHMTGRGLVPESYSYKGRSSFT